MAAVGGRMGAVAKGHRVVSELVSVLCLAEGRVAHLYERAKNHGIGRCQWVNRISEKLARKRNVCVCAAVDKTC